MAITTEAVYEQGVLRPVQPIPLAEGEQVEVIIVSKPDQGKQSPSEILAQIAAMPTEENAQTFSGRDYDRLLYNPNGAQ